MAKLLKKKAKKKFNSRYLRVYSRHPSHSPLRKNNGGILLPELTAIRLGSSTEASNTNFEINSVQAVQNSANKLSMKRCFEDFQDSNGDEDNNVLSTAQWWETIDELIEEDEIPYPIIAKLKYGSRGRGMVKINDRDQLDVFMENNRTNRFIFEKFYNYSREYRLHVSANGCFYTCRKMLRSDTPEEQRWFRNDSNSIWALETNDNFDRPTNWNTIVEHCVNALNAVGLDVGACDVRVQSATNNRGEQRENPSFIIVEINSAPSFGEITTEKYKEEIPKIFRNKYGRR